MIRPFDKYTIYDFSDEEIVTEICRRIKSLRFSCCFSQEELAQRAGVSAITIKRIENGKVKDLSLTTLLKILRASGTLAGAVDFLPEFPASPYLFNVKTGKQLQRFNSKRKNA